MTQHKQVNKNTRAPLGAESAANKLSHAEKVRLAMGKQAQLDASFYQRLPEYQGMTFFWENDIDGAVEKWLHIGAELVPRRSKSIKQFKGFTDRAQNEFECVPVGGGITAYLLFMPEKEYHELRIAPKEARNKEILYALGTGRIDEESKVMGSVKGIKTYAPNLPTGGRGFEQTHDA